MMLMSIPRNPKKMKVEATQKTESPAIKNPTGRAGIQSKTAGS